MSIAYKTKIFLLLNSLFFCIPVYPVKVPSYYKGNEFYTINFEQEQKPLVVIVCTYNNARWFDRNLKSIFDQKYSNYRVVIIDDYSNDGTGDLIEKYIKDHGQEHRCTLIKNQQRSYKMSNLYKAIHACDNNEIVVEYDGDDWFLDDRVFSYLNELYSSSDTWLTYGGYQEYPSGRPGFCRQIPTETIESNNFRSYYRITSQLRTFYAGLFKNIPLEDLIFEGKFFQTTSDVAQMLPMFEMAGERIAFNYRKLYVYNLANIINDHKVDAKLQTRANDYVLNRRKLTTISDYSILPDERVKNAQGDVVIITESPEKLNNTINNVKFLTNGSEIHVICSNYYNQSKQYDLIAEQYGNFVFHKIASSDLTTIAKIMSELRNDHIFCINDFSKITTSIDLNKCIRILEKTRAFAWYCKSNMNVSDFSEIEKNIYALQFGQKKMSLQNAYTFESALYRKQTILDALKNCNASIENIEHFLNQKIVAANTIALFTPMN